MSRAPISVGQLTGYIADLFRYDDVLTDVWVEGEVTSTSVSKAGHHYFRLGDDSTAINCVLFQQKARQQSFLPEAGGHFLLHGSVGVYEASGTYQLYVDVVQPAGLGLMALEFARLRMKLQEEGLFEPSRKRPLPPFPSVIGVVTSESGAVWQDIQTVIARRYPLVKLLLAPAQVQGLRAPQSISTGLSSLLETGLCDLVIVARGGGATEDLAAFNDEQLVRALFASPIPVISAVGHESDWTLCDEVADVRAATPSAAAELATPLVSDLLEHVGGRRLVLRSMLTDTLQELRESSASASRALSFRHPAHKIRAHRSVLSQLNRQFRVSSQLQQHERRSLVTVADTRVRRLSGFVLSGQRLQLLSASTRCAARNPSETIARGYAVLEHESGGRITSVSGLSANSRFNAYLADGAIHAHVDSLT